MTMPAFAVYPFMPVLIFVCALAYYLKKKRKQLGRIEYSKKETALILGFTFLGTALAYLVSVLLYNTWSPFGTSWNQNPLPISLVLLPTIACALVSAKGKEGGGM